MCIRHQTSRNEVALQHRDDQVSAGRLPSSLISILPWLRKGTGAPRDTRTGRRLPIEGSGEGRVSGEYGVPLAMRSSSAALPEHQDGHSSDDHYMRRWQGVGRGLKALLLGGMQSKATQESALGRTLGK
jgi:hypothetical protein